MGNKGSSSFITNATRYNITVMTIEKKALINCFQDTDSITIVDGGDYLNDNFINKDQSSLSLFIKSNSTLKVVNNKIPLNKTFTLKVIIQNFEKTEIISGNFTGNLKIIVGEKDDGSFTISESSEIDVKRAINSNQNYFYLDKCKVCKQKIGCLEGCKLLKKLGGKKFEETEIIVPAIENDKLSVSDFEDKQKSSLKNCFSSKILFESTNFTENFDYSEIFKPKKVSILALFSEYSIKEYRTLINTKSMNEVVFTSNSHEFLLKKNIELLEKDLLPSLNTNEENNFPFSYKYKSLISNNSTDLNFVMLELKAFFSTDEESFILIICGYGDLDKENNAFFLLNDLNKIYFKDIKELFKNHKNKNLLIMYDASYSGYWVKEAKELKSLKNISVIASTTYSNISNNKENDFPYDLPFIGSYFLYNIINFNSNIELIKENKKKVKSKLNPSFHGDLKSISENFNLKLIFEDNSFTNCLNKSYLTTSKLSLFKNKKIYFSKYIGEFNNTLNLNSRSGKGIEYTSNGDKYEGEFLNDKYEGCGRYYWNSGHKYKGELKNNLMHGKGTHYWANGDYYSGYFEKGKMNGSGTFYWKNGDKYKGLWKNDLRHGDGIYYWKNGTYLEGRWENGQRVDIKLNFSITNTNTHTNTKHSSKSSCKSRNTCKSSNPSNIGSSDGELPTRQTSQPHKK